MYVSRQTATAKAGELPLRFQGRRSATYNITYLL
jgi:hypothetical protein